MRTVLSIAGIWFGAALLSGFQQTDGWLGTWQGETKEGVTYTIKVNDKYKGMNLCEVHAGGIQTFYTLECWATGTPTTLNVADSILKCNSLFLSVLDGCQKA